MPRPVLDGTGLLRPAWDFAGRLWEVQDGPHGARVICVEHDRPRAVRIPGITGADVRHFLVSRDGSRLVALLRGPRTDRIVVSRLRYAVDGGAIHGTRAATIPWSSSGTSRIRDIGWTSPTTLAVLDQLSRAQAESRILNIDGSTPAAQASPILISGSVHGLTTSPSGTPYARLEGSLYDLAQVDATPNVPTPHLHHLAYAG
jgi:hypothetical protein